MYIVTTQQRVSDSTRILYIELRLHFMIVGRDNMDPQVMTI